MKKTVSTLLGVASLCLAAGGVQAMSHGDEGDKHQKKMWNKLDTDGDGAISRQEYMDAMGKHFERADTDSDGKISKEEWQARKDAMRSEMHKDRSGMQ